MDDVTFTHLYTDLDLIEMINPTIVTSGNWLKNRQYHKIVTDERNDAPEVPVYSPVDATAVSITHYSATMRPWDRPAYDASQFDIRFEASCDVGFWFDHVSRLVEPFASLASTQPATETRNAAVSIRVDVRAGDLIGWTTGTDPAHVWDFVLVDQRRTVQFANQARYEGTGDLEHLLHTACPYDYFDTDLRSAFVAKFGWWGGSTEAAACGAAVDVPGTLAGGWFLRPFDAAATSIDPGAGWGMVAKIEADGWVYLVGPDWEVRTSPTDLSFADPAEVTLSHCFRASNDPDRWVYVELDGPDRVAAASGMGTCPTGLPESSRVYYR